jgi:6-pyruvoyltetrahydropterin/6-carboxytetrahydropterin synthase
MISSEPDMPESYSVRIAKAEHVFSAAHFIIYGGQCERLHGHNYRVAAEIHGTLDDDSLVVDFLAVREALREIIARLDHYTLLPTEHPTILVREEGEAVKVKFQSRHWQFPRGDCQLLPIANTTAELLASYIGLELKRVLESRCGLEEPQLRVELDECDGQLAVWEYRPR